MDDPVLAGLVPDRCIGLRRRRDRILAAALEDATNDIGDHDHAVAHVAATHDTSESEVAMAGAPGPGRKEVGRGH